MSFESKMMFVSIINVFGIIFIGAGTAALGLPVYDFKENTFQFLNTGVLICILAGWAYLVNQVKFKLIAKDFKEREEKEKNSLTNS